MVVPPESILPGRCYLADRGSGPRVCRVEAVFPDGRLEYSHREARPKPPKSWSPGRTSVELFAALVEREVACDWRPEAPPKKVRRSVVSMKASP